MNLILGGMIEWRIDRLEGDLDDGWICWSEVLGPELGLVLMFFAFASVSSVFVVFLGSIGTMVVLDDDDGDGDDDD